MADATCAIPGCPDPSYKRQPWCRNHYQRVRRHGDPLGGRPARNRPIEDRFWSNVEVGHPAGCWWWAGRVGTNGYGVFALGPRVLGRVYAHRFAYETLVGIIPPGRQPDHLCRNRLCVNPDHLEVVTPGENTRRGGPARRTHCKRGHLLAGGNLYIGNGRRSCRKYRAMLARRYYYRKRAA
jgi:hypothetical protein